jgi:hypothetical protein
LADSGVRDRLVVSRRAIQEIDLERFHLKNLNDGEVTEKYQITIIRNLQLSKLRK